MHFTSTRWTTVLRAGKPDSPEAEQALGRLCEDYRRPLYEFALSKFRSPEDAEDVTQGFLFHFVRKNIPGAVSGNPGRFRTFLLACFKNFIRDEWRRRNRVGCIPPGLVVSMSPPEGHTSFPLEPAVQPEPDSQVDVVWAATIRDRVLRALEKDYQRRNKSATFQALLPLLTGEGTERPYADIATALGVSKDAIKMEVLRLRQSFRQRFREEVAETLSDLNEVSAESNYLLSLLFSAEKSAG
jgi:RNA polymerase sigma factor (sigma-70 family)